MIDFCSVRHCAHVATEDEMKCGFTVELSGLNLGSGIFRNVDEISIQGSACAQ